MRKELLAVIYRLKQFRQYSLGRHFVIWTDHAALSWFRKTPEPMPLLARRLTLIEQYDYEVVHRHGKQHANANGLSRRPTTSQTADDRQVQVKQVQIESEISSAKNDQRIQTARILNDQESTLVKSVNADTTSASTDDEQLSAPTNRLCHKAVRTVDLEPKVVHLLVRGE